MRKDDAVIQSKEKLDAAGLETALVSVARWGAAIELIPTSPTDLTGVFKRWSVVVGGGTDG
jgi:hypothetical protein